MGHRPVVGDVVTFERDAMDHRGCVGNAPPAEHGAFWTCPHGIRYQMLPGIYTVRLRWQYQPVTPRRVAS